MNNDNRGLCVLLAREHEGAFRKFQAELSSSDEVTHGYFFKDNKPFDEVVSTLDDWAQGKSLPSGWVPSTTWFWLKDDELLGVINLRHHLTPILREMGGHIGYTVLPSQRRRGIAKAMLKEVLSRCPQLGLDAVLVTCNAKNIGSVRTIEANGGVLDREVYFSEEDELRRFYWINTKASN